MRISDWSSDVCSSDLVEPADAGSQRFGAARSAPRQVPMHLQEETEPTPDPTAPTAPPGSTTTVAPVPDEPTAENDLPLGLIGGGATAAVAAATAALVAIRRRRSRSEEHTSELQSLMRSSYAVFCLQKQTTLHPIKDTQPV